MRLSRARQAQGSGCHWAELASESEPESHLKSVARTEVNEPESWAQERSDRRRPGAKASGDEYLSDLFGLASIRLTEYLLAVIEELRFHLPVTPVPSSTCLVSRLLS